MRQFSLSLALAIRCMLLVTMLGFPLTGCDDTPDDDTDGDSDVDADSSYPCGCISDMACDPGDICLDCWCVSLRCSSHADCPERIEHRILGQCANSYACVSGSIFIDCEAEYSCTDSDICITKSFCFPDCYSGEICKEPESHIFCQSNADCNEDERCEERTFCTPPCTTDADCPHWRPVCRDATWCSQQ